MIWVSIKISNLWSTYTSFHCRYLRPNDSASRLLGVYHCTICPLRPESAKFCTGWSVSLTASRTRLSSFSASWTACVFPAKRSDSGSTPWSNFAISHQICGWISPRVRKTFLSRSNTRFFTSAAIPIRIKYVIPLCRQITYLSGVSSLVQSLLQTGVF